MKKEILKQLIISSIEVAYRRSEEMKLNKFDKATYMFIAGMRLNRKINEIV